jgi:hypothetical protein
MYSLQSDVKFMYLVIFHAEAAVPVPCAIGFWESRKAISSYQLEAILALRYA